MMTQVIFRKPMLCQQVKSDELANMGGMICQDKMDGCRAIITVSNGNVHIQGRKNPSIGHRYPELMSIFPDNFNGVIDAEIVTKDLDFNHLLSREQNNKPFRIDLLKNLYPTKVCAFDILEKDGIDLTMKPNKERLDILRQSIPDNDDIQVLPYYTNLVERFDIIKKQNGEGIIVKNPNGLYDYGKRSKDWIKVKHWKETIIEFVKYEENPAGITVTSKDNNRVLVAGFSSPIVKDLIDRDGKVSLEIQYLNKTKTGALRMPTYKSIVK